MNACDCPMGSAAHPICLRKSRHPEGFLGRIPQVGTRKTADRRVGHPGLDRYVDKLLHSETQTTSFWWTRQRKPSIELEAHTASIFDAHGQACEDWQYRSTRSRASVDLQALLHGFQVAFQVQQCVPHMKHARIGVSLQEPDKGACIDIASLFPLNASCRTGSQPANEFRMHSPLNRRCQNRNDGGNGIIVCTESQFREFRHRASVCQSVQLLPERRHAFPLLRQIGGCQEDPHQFANVPIRRPSYPIRAETDCSAPHGGAPLCEQLRPVGTIDEVVPTLDELAAMRGTTSPSGARNAIAKQETHGNSLVRAGQQRFSGPRHAIAGDHARNTPEGKAAIRRTVLRDFKCRPIECHAERLSAPEVQRSHELLRAFIQ